MKSSIIKSKYIFSATTIIFIIALWFILSAIVKNTYVFPTFNMLLQAGKTIVIDNFNIILLTIVKILLGVVIASFISALIFVIYILKKDFIGFFTPILSFIHVVPTMAISVYLYLFVDISLIPFLLVIMVTVPIMVEGLITAYDNIDKGIMDMLKLEQISFFKKLFKVYIPIMLPYILMIFLQSFSLGLKAMVMGEYLSITPNSLGFLIYNSQTLTSTENIIVILIILFVISIICEIVIKLLQSKINKYLLIK